MMAHQLVGELVGSGAARLPDQTLKQQLFDCGVYRHRR
jgi:hypothetical protein